MPSGEGLRVLTAAVYRGRLPGVSCLAARTTFAKPPEQRHSGDGPYPCCPRPNCRTPRLYHIEGCVSVCHRLPSARQRHRWYHRRRRRGGSERAAPTASEALSSIWLPRPWPGGRVITSIRATYIVLQTTHVVFYRCCSTGESVSYLPSLCRTEGTLPNPKIASPGHYHTLGCPKGTLGSADRLHLRGVSTPVDTTPMGRTRGSVGAWG